MKTTVEIAEGVLVEAKRIAARDGVTLRVLLESGLRRELEVRQQASEYTLPSITWDLGGPQPEFRNATFAKMLEESYRGRGT